MADIQRAHAGAERVLGLNRVAATEFAFLVGIPTMLAAGGLKILKALRHYGGAPAEDWGMVALGFFVAAVVSFFAVKWLLRYVQTHTFIAFGWYRIALAIFIAILLLSENRPSPSKLANSRSNSLVRLLSHPLSGST